MAGDDHSELFKRAAAIASNVPESMQDAAFRRALDLLLEEAEGDGSSPVESDRGTKRNPHQKRGSSKRSSGSNDSDDRASILLAGINRTAYPQIADTPRLLDKALWLLRTAHDDFSIDGLSASEISKVLKDKFRLTYSRQGVGQALDKASRLVDRDTSGPVVRFRIMAPGETHLDNPDKDVKKAKTAKRSRPKTKQAPKGSAKQPKDKGKDSQLPKRGGRPTPFTVLDGLVTSGFFGAPQTIGGIREYLEEKQGRKYKASELSPALLRLLRNGKLTRAKNSDKQYEYSSG
jgi:transposase